MNYSYYLGTFILMLSIPIWGAAAPLNLDKDSLISSELDNLKVQASFQERDVVINEFLQETLTPIRENYFRINSIVEWDTIRISTERNKSNLKDAQVYVNNQATEKIIVRTKNSDEEKVIEYYFLDDQLSMVVERTYTYLLQHSEEEDAIRVDRFYFKDGTLLHALMTGDCGAPFSRDFLNEEQARILEAFMNVLVD